jgi:hypothetical protein
MSAPGLALMSQTPPRKKLRLVCKPQQQLVMMGH